MKTKFAVDDSVLVDDDDAWVGTVIGFKDGLLKVEDQDGDLWLVAPERAVLLDFDDEQLPESICDDGSIAVRE